MTAEALATYEERYPEIEWREPIKISRSDSEWGWACRVCVAMAGLSGRDIPGLTRSRQEVYEHIKKEHFA